MKLIKAHNAANTSRSFFSERPEASRNFKASRKLPQFDLAKFWPTKKKPELWPSAAARALRK